MVILICICLISSEAEHLFKGHSYFLFSEMLFHVEVRFLYQLFHNKAVILIAS